MDALAAVSFVETVLVEDEIAVSRAPTLEAEMMVRLDDGAWHRPMMRTVAACGVAIQPNTPAYPTRYEGTMCQHGCWSENELIEAQAANDVANEDRQTSRFVRVDRSAPSRPRTLTEISAEQDEYSRRIRARVAEIKAERAKEK